MKVSVIIPTFKPKEYLYECLDSLCNQTFDKHDFEVILILNGPSFPYEQTILDYKKTHSELQLIYHYTEETGVSNARNLGINAAKGVFIGFIDDDDFVSNTYIEELYNQSDRNTIGLAYPYAFNDGEFNIQLRYGITDDYNHYAPKGLVSFLRPRKYFSGPCMKLIHRDIIGKRRFDVHFKNGEDSLFMFLISDCMDRVCFTSKGAVYYRRFRSESASVKKKKIFEYIKNRCEMIFVYTSIYFQNVCHYSFFFYLTRLLGSIKTIFVH